LRIEKARRGACLGDSAPEIWLIITQGFHAN
jgi:hypothetical protein